MIRLKSIFHRLDLQLSLIVGGFIVLWFISFLVSARIMNKERYEKNSYLERERIQLRISAEQTRILNDLLLEHRKSLELTMEDLYHSLNLSWIDVLVKKKPLIRFGSHKKSTDHFVLEQNFPIIFDGKEFAIVSIGKELWILNDSEVVNKKWMFGIAVAMISIFFVIRLFIQKQIVNPVNLLIRYFGTSESNGKESGLNYQSHSSEMDGLIQSFKKMREQLLEAQSRMSEQEKQAVLGSLAAQVAHDIRSPLTALSVVNEDLSELPESKRLLVRSAVSRIRDIANDLLEKKNATRLPLPEQEEVASVQLLTGLLENIVSEKRIQYRSRFNISIEANLEAAYGIFVYVKPVKLKNVLSNVLNNAVESISEKGEVTLSVEKGNGAISITVADTGKGISFDRQKQLFQQGATFDKVGGSGLGLYQAKKDLEEWGGRISMDSVPGKGTKVRLFLPEATKPRWFVEKLKLRTDAVIGILDDDVSIHHTWKRRFENTLGKTNQLVHFSTPEELAAWLKKPGNLCSLLLVDYELKGQSASGLDVVETLGLQDRAVLVTSHSDEAPILERCESLGVALIPKSMADTVPIEIANRA